MCGQGDVCYYKVAFTHHNHRHHLGDKKFKIQVEILIVPGLTLELFIEQDEYVPELTENAGVRVTIHPQDRMPFPEDDGLLASADFMTMIGVTMVSDEKIQISDEDKY